MEKLILILFALCFQLLHAQPIPTWSSSNGHSFQGTFVSMGAQSVTLRGTDGNKVTVPLVALNETSQEQARKAHQIAVKNAPIYTHKNNFLRFSLYAKRMCLHIEFLDGNTLLNNEIYEVRLLLEEVVKNEPRKWIEIKEILGEPEVGRRDVTMRLLMENGVKIAFTVEVNDKNQVTYSVKTEEIPDGLPPLSLCTGVHFPKLLNYDMETKSYKGALSKEGVNFADLPKFFEGYEIQVEDYNSKKVTVPYYEKQTHGYGGRKYTVIRREKKDFMYEGPKKRENGWFHISFYNGTSPFEGYFIRSFAGDNDNLESGPFTISLK